MIVVTGILQKLRVLISSPGATTPPTTALTWYAAFANFAQRANLPSVEFGVATSSVAVDVLAAPANDNEIKLLQLLCITNPLGVSVTFSVFHYDGTTTTPLNNITLAVGEKIYYANGEWTIYDSSGKAKCCPSGSGAAAWGAITGTLSDQTDLKVALDLKEDKYITVVAQEDLTQFDLVTGDGRVANSGTLAHRNKVVGFAAANILTGFSGSVKTFGIIQNGAWSWTAGDKIFLNGTSVSTTATSTGFTVCVGVAVASDTISINIQPSIRF